MIFYDFYEKIKSIIDESFKNDTNHLFIFIILRPESTVSSQRPKNKNRLGDKSGGGELPPNHLRLAP